MKQLFMLIVITIALCGCLGNSDDPISSLEISGQNVNVLYLNNINDSIILKLSDIAGDLHFIRLQYEIA